ncbi:alkaline phosphatase family protein [Sphingomonas aracearum]|uniref:alkaline phosphatase family protein n=1 Tax=Sphingomonas aracearum TaxID=2283317 RepID=UPI001EF0F873|nr:alkaline phosphatase family protein [Sphingomonas aracearum]
MKRLSSLVALAVGLAAAPLLAQEGPRPIEVAPSAVATAPQNPPKLIVAISVDQFSADLFAEYRNHFREGFARLLTGVVFPSGYQSHAATETCPGHSTILTGYRPTHTGIIANNWLDLAAPRADKTVYCAEDESVIGSDHERYTVSDKHLKVPTLGERMRAANPATRVVSVAGKDRAAVMMGGHNVDELWWWDGKAFASYAGRPAPEAVTRVNAATNEVIARGQPALPVPDFCVAHDRAVDMPGGFTIGRGRFERAPGDARPFRASPAFDAAVFDLATQLVRDMKLGQGAQTDIIDVGASATDYVGHSLGTEGLEMCLQLASLDHTIGQFLNALDATGVDYEVVLTADHGGHDAPERHQQRAMPRDARVSDNISAEDMGKAIGAALKLKGPVLYNSEGNIFVDPALLPRQRALVLAEAKKRFQALPQVAAALTRAEIEKTALATTPPETWTLAERVRASYDAKRSGDIVLLLKPRVVPIPKPGPGYVATHGSPWDYDRRVPILFWRRGLTGFEQPLSVETVDIAPTLAATIGLPMPGVDGRCLDLDGGPGSTCPAE